MKTYTFSFYGKQTGAIGIDYNITQSYEATDELEAAAKLLVDYWPRNSLKLNGEDFKLTTEHFNHKIDYKGLGMARK